MHENRLSLGNSDVISNMTKIDQKRFVSKPSAAKFIAESLAADNMPPLSRVFADSECGFFENDSQKIGKTMIQFGFLISDPSHGVMLTPRAKLSESAAGHTVTTGYSVLIGWSPIYLPPDRTFPEDMTDVASIYHQKIEEDAGVPEPRFRLLGVVGNPSKGINYCFFVFSATYPILGPTFKRLKKDLTDIPQGIQPLDDSLFTKVAHNKANLRALELFSGRDLSRYGYGDSVMARASNQDRLS